MKKQQNQSNNILWKILAKYFSQAEHQWTKIMEVGQGL